MLCQELLHFGQGTFQDQLDRAYAAFKAFCISKKIPHSQPPFTVRLVPCRGPPSFLYWAEVLKKTGELLCTAKAYNNRCILEYLAFTLREAVASGRYRDHERLLLSSVCLILGAGLAGGFKC